MSATDTPVPGIDIGPVTAWLEANVAGARGPFEFEVIAGGHSNLTFKVTGADGTRYVLRRPPLGHVLASAHDMGREHRIISGLQRSAVPVAPALGFCDDPSVNGAPFYVMGFVDGYVLRDKAAAEAVLSVEARRTASESLVDTMAAIHAVDLEAAGLADLSRHEGYIARQLKRWYGQWNQQKTRDLPAVDLVHDELSRRMGADEVLVELGPGPKLAEVQTQLQALPGVNAVQPQQGGPAEGLALRLEVAPKADPRAQIFETAVKQGWSLRELHLVERNLEDVFRQLTRGN